MRLSDLVILLVVCLSNIEGKFYFASEINELCGGLRICFGKRWKKGDCWLWRAGIFKRRGGVPIV